MPTWIVVTAVIVIIVIGLIAVVQMIAIAALLFVIKNLAEEIRERVDPLISKVNSLLVTANEIAQNVQGKTEHITDKAAQTTDVLSNRVEKLSGFMQGVVTAPVIKGSAMMEGVVRGFRVWRGLRKRREVEREQEMPESPSSIVTSVGEEMPLEEEE
jgi:uncharacterized protein YoxC